MNSTHTARHEPPCLPALSASPPLLAVPVACSRRCCYGKQAQHDTRLATAWTDATQAEPSSVLRPLVLRLIGDRCSRPLRRVLVCPPGAAQSDARKRLAAGWCLRHGRRARPPACAICNCRCGVADHVDARSRAVRADWTGKRRSVTHSRGRWLGDPDRERSVRAVRLESGKLTARTWWVSRHRPRACCLATRTGPEGMN